MVTEGEKTKRTAPDLEFVALETGKQIRESDDYNHTHKHAVGRPWSEPTVCDKLGGLGGSIP